MSFPIEYSDQELFEQFYQDVLKLYNPPDYLLEVALDRSPILKDIDRDFTNLKNDIRGVEYRKDLTENLKKFIKVKHITLKIKKDWYNASVIPTYNRNLPISLKERILGAIKGQTDYPIMTAEENQEYIDKVTIFIGDKLIQELSSRELTAVLLHELGHVFAHTSNFPSMIGSVAKALFGIGLIKQTVSTIHQAITGHGIIDVLSPVSIVVTLSMLVATRTLTFIEHAGEMQADKFAAKYGYGEEMIRVLHKFKIDTAKFQAKKGFFRKIFDMVKFFFFPSTHPKDSKRICRVSDQMMKEYKDMYPELKNDITTILSDLKCDKFLTKVKNVL